MAEMASEPDDGPRMISYNGCELKINDSADPTEAVISLSKQIARANALTSKVKFNPHRNRNVAEMAWAPTKSLEYDNQFIDPFKDVDKVTEAPDEEEDVSSQISESDTDSEIASIKTNDVSSDESEPEQADVGIEAKYQYKENPNLTGWQTNVDRQLFYNEKDRRCIFR